MGDLLQEVENISWGFVGGFVAGFVVGGGEYLLRVCWGICWGICCRWWRILVGVFVGGIVGLF